MPAKPRPPWPTRSKDTSNSVRVAAAMALAEIGGDAREAVPALIKTLDDKDVEVRGAAIFALGEIGPDARASILALTRRLKDDDPDIRKAAALRWGRFRSPSRRERGEGEGEKGRTNSPPSPSPLLPLSPSSCIRPMADSSGRRGGLRADRR